MHQGLCQCAGVLHDLLRVVLELGLHRLVERNGFAGDDVLERAALPAWENSLVDGSAVLRLAENAAAARAAQGLVRGEGDDVRVWNWVGVRATCNETGQVRSVEHEHRAHFVRDCLERGGVEAAGVAGCASNDQLGAVLQREVAHLVHIDALLPLRHLVGHEAVELAAGVDGRAMRQVTAVVEAETQHRVAGLQDGLIRAHVGVGTTVRLHVGVLGAEQFLHAGDCKRFDLVDDGVAAVVALAGKTLGVLVGQRTADRAHDGGRGEVLTGDELEAGALTLHLGIDEVKDDGVWFGIAGERHVMTPGRRVGALRRARSA